MTSFAFVFTITSGYLIHRIIKQEEINFEKKMIEKEIQTINAMSNNNENEAIIHINKNHFVPAFSNSEEKIVNPFCYLAHSYILGKMNNNLIIVVIPNANKTQNEEEVKESRPNALLQLLTEREEEINAIYTRDESFFNFLKPQNNNPICIFYQEDNRNSKSIKP